jgi:hypothetical protein
MVNHDGAPVCHGPGGPSMGYPAYSNFKLNRAPELWLAAHLECAKEGRQRVHSRPRALSKVFEVAVIRRGMVAYAPW